MSKKNKAIILGAGPAGLVTAWKLLENNWDVEIYEKNKTVGGMCRSWKWKGFIVDTGPHIFHTPHESLIKLWKEEFGDLLLEGKFWCQNVQGDEYNEYWDYPLSWESISKKYPIDLKKKIYSELKNLKKFKKDRATSFSEYIAGQTGPTLYDMFFRRYPKKIWGIDAEKITAEWAPKRIEIRKKMLPFYYGQYSAVGKYGTGAIYERIKDKILKLGGKVFLNQTITGIEIQNNKIIELNCLSKRNIKILNDDVIVSTLPITLTAKLLGYNSKLKFRGIKSVYLHYDKKQILPDKYQWFYYDDLKILFNRITETKKLTKFTAPKNQTMLTAEITFSAGDEIDRMGDKKVMEKVIEEISKVNLVEKKYLKNVSINTESFVYPVQTKGYNEELSKAKSIINKYDKLYSIGTGGEFNYADSQILFHKAFDIVEVLCNVESQKSQVIRKININRMNTEIKIGKNKIGDNNRTYIIAEIGLNHNNNLEIAKELIDKAKKIGCDCVKFQTYDLNSRVSNKVKSAKYSETTIGLEENLNEMFNKLQLNKEDHKKLFKYARKKNIEIFSTPFDFRSVDFLEDMNVNLYKVASMDIVNLPLIKKVAETKKPVILSCGMSTLGQVEEAVNTVKETGNNNLMLLHCNSSDPASLEEMNLKVIETLKTSFKVPVGLSDHTFGLLSSQLAISLGANLIERHFTLDRAMEGPDHILSSEPEEMKKLVEYAKLIPKMLGDGVKVIQPNEYLTLNSQRKSLYASKNIKKGQIINSGMIAIKGPGGGLLPKYIEIVIGRTAKNNIDKDLPIMWKDI